MADFTKDGGQIDEWAVVTAATMRKGAEMAIPSDMEIAVEITTAKVEATAHDGEDTTIIEVSGNTTGNEDWTEYLKFKGTPGTADTTELAGGEPGGETAIALDADGDFAVRGALYFIKNAAAIGDSEIVRNNGNPGGNVLTILDGLTNAQADDDDIYNIVDQWIIVLPAAFRRARVLVNNLDADCDIVSRTRAAYVTDLE